MWTVAIKLTSLLEVRDTRGAKEAGGLIGKNYNGVIICDKAKCYFIYSSTLGNKALTCLQLAFNTIP